MGLYEKYVLPKLIDTACAQKPMRRLRDRYLPRARGDVLEIGVGSGLNLPHYGPEVRSLTALDPAVELTDRARQRAAAAAMPVKILQISGEEIPAEAARFDSIVCTWTLCSIPNVYAALREMRRVLKPDGEFVFIEHGAAPDAPVRRWQRRLEPLWKRIGGGCHLTRDTRELIQDAGFCIDELATGYEPGPRWATFMTHGVARRTR